MWHRHAVIWNEPDHRVAVVFKRVKLHVSTRYIMHRPLPVHQAVPVLEPF